jgi:hypothetical protein
MARGEEDTHRGRSKAEHDSLVVGKPERVVEAQWARQ